MNLFLEAGKLQEQGETFSIATLISSKGSTPRKTAKMIVRRNGSIIGTIGGGLAEAFIIKEALSAMQNGQSRMVEYILDSNNAGGIQMLCGGKLTVYIEVVLQKPRIVMIGGGHVGMAVAKLVEFLGYQLVIVDDRQEFANAEKYPMAVEHSWDPDMEKAIEPVRIDGNTFVVIATKDSDDKALKKVIHTDAAYIGMIGSSRKVGIVFEQLLKEGVRQEKVQHIHAPVGLDIGSETPEEIAVSIMAEILKVRNGRSGLSYKELNKHAE